VHSPGLAILLTGLSGAGKTSIARELGTRLTASGYGVTMLDGDDLRSRISPDLGFSRSDREANLARAGIIASEVVKHGGITICSFIAPYEQARREFQEMVKQYGTFFLVYVSTPVGECERRDPKGLYRKARAGCLDNFTGISDIYEIPAICDLRIDTTGLTVNEAVDRIAGSLAAHGFAAGLWVAVKSGERRTRDKQLGIGLLMPESGGSRYTTLCERVLRAVGERRLTLSEVARLVGVERHTVEKAVRSVTGQTFRQLQRSLLIERAKLLLAQGRSIKEVAFDLGFASPQSFHRFVRSTSGKTPSWFRQWV
jgi:sulfate adenylyltransferase